MQIKLIFMWNVLHEDSFSDRDKLNQNSEMGYYFGSGFTALKLLYAQEELVAPK